MIADDVHREKDSNLEVGSCHPRHTRRSDGMYLVTLTLRAFEDVDFLEAQDDYVAIHAGKRSRSRSIGSRGSSPTGRTAGWPCCATGARFRSAGMVTDSCGQVCR